MLDILKQLKCGALDLHAYLDGLMDQIDRTDKQLHCFVKGSVNRQRVHAEADAVLARYPGPADRPPLFGLAVGVKDIIRADGLETRCGSRLPAELFAGTEAGLVSRLKNQGAIVLGKTATTEFAWKQPAPTKNPLNPAHTPGGSSSGSAAAVAAGLLPMALGTQTIGSVIRPAAYCGVVGVKPSARSLPTDGIIPFSNTFDQPGYFTRDLEGAASIAAAICEEKQLGHQGPLEAGKKPLIGLPDKAFLHQADQAVHTAFNQWLGRLKQAGFCCIQTNLFQNIGQINELHQKLAAREFARNHRAWYARYGPLYSRHSKELIDAGRAVSEDEAQAALDLRAGVSLELETHMQGHGIDCWISPASTSFPPLGLDSTGNPLMNLPWTFTGVPSICVSMPVREQPFPLGLQLCTERNGLSRLFGHARAILDILQ